MSFVVTVKGDRLNASYEVPTAGEAVEKAKGLLGHGKVTVTDPSHDEWSSENFYVMLQRWANNRKST